jgi:hypothetical protein
MWSPAAKKLFEYDSFVLHRLWNNLFSKLPHGAFGEIAQPGHLLNVTNHDSRRPKYMPREDSRGSTTSLSSSYVLAAF